MANRERRNPAVKNRTPDRRLSKRLMITRHNATHARKRLQTHKTTQVATAYIKKYLTFSLPVEFHVQTSWEAKQGHENLKRKVRNDMDKTTSRMGSPDKRR